MHARLYIVPEAPEIKIISSYLQDSTSVNGIVTIDCIVKKTVRYYSACDQFDKNGLYLCRSALTLVR